VSVRVYACMNVCMSVCVGVQHTFAVPVAHLLRAGLRAEAAHLRPFPSPPSRPRRHISNPRRDSPPGPRKTFRNVRQTAVPVPGWSGSKCAIHSRCMQQCLGGEGAL
jgi:hypothetical protein